MKGRRAAAAIALLAIFAGPASASHGATFTTDPPSYSYLDGASREVVQLNFLNHGATDLYLANAAPFRILRDGEVAYEAGAIEAIHAIPPGASYQQDWDLATSCGVLNAVHRMECVGIATPGRYSAEWTYHLALPLGETVVLSTEFEIEPSGALPK